MSAYLVRPRSSIVDPELARAAVVDLPPVGLIDRRPDASEALMKAIASLRGPVEPEGPIILTLAPVPARARR